MYAWAWVYEYFSHLNDYMCVKSNYYNNVLVWLQHAYNYWIQFTAFFAEFGVSLIIDFRINGNRW